MMTTDPRLLTALSVAMNSAMVLGTKTAKMLIDKLLDGIEEAAVEKYGAKAPYSLAMVSCSSARQILNVPDDDDINMSDLIASKNREEK